ncbi:hypothetical protein JCGZ_10728 [Jatropha curcas]|uniref:MATH domain-containing protein n=1 Tax=Jatropha curcas TaxID=180498 RepID=A0A067KHU1_JATCU|nr:hypothetical protein JCGZ_10728 [Jatropha curcas]
MVLREVMEEAIAELTAKEEVKSVMEEAISELTIKDEETDGKERIRRFRGTKREWGLDQFVSLDAFYDASNGYLVDDGCIFGAEILVIECTGKSKGECLSIVKEIAKNFQIKTWNFMNLRSLSLVGTNDGCIYLRVDWIASRAKGRERLWFILAMTLDSTKGFFILLSKV